MIDNKKANSKTNIHQRTLRIVYKDNISSIEKLQRMENPFVYTIEVLGMVIELFKVKSNLSNRKMYSTFETRNLNCNLRPQTDFIRTLLNTSNFGSNSLNYLATKIWDLVPYNIKSVVNLNSFRKKINWKPKRCHCRLCKQFGHDVGICGHFLIYIYCF